MKNKFDILFAVSAMLILAGAVLNLWYPVAAPYIFSIGVVCIIVVRIKTMYKGNDFRIKRLQSMQFLGTLLYIPAAYFMFLQSRWWVLFLTMAAIFELVSSFRMPSKK